MSAIRQAKLSRCLQILFVFKNWGGKKVDKYVTDPKWSLWCFHTERCTSDYSYQSQQRGERTGMFCPTLSKISRPPQWYSSRLKLRNNLEYDSWHWRVGLVGRGPYCSSRAPEFSSQHACQLGVGLTTAWNPSTRRSDPFFWPSQASAVPCTYAHIDTQTYIILF